MTAIALLSGCAGIVWEDTKWQGPVINVKEVAPWVAVPQSYGSPRAARNERLPYRLHILTISPLVVLAVPRDQTDNDYCSGNIFVQGCLPTEKFILEPYWWLRTPKVRPNSFWFAPEMPNTVQYLPNDQQKHTIDLKNSTLILTAKAGSWEVARNAP